MLSAHVYFAPSALQVLEALEADRSKSAQGIARRVRRLAVDLAQNFLHGEVVRKKSLPRELLRKHDAENLYVEDLPSFWRLLYMVKREAGHRFVLIVEIVPHATYDRWFPGRSR